MCRRHHEVGDDDDEGMETERQNPSVGQKLVGGLEKKYTVKRASRTEGGESEPFPDYGLPQVSTSSMISLPLTGQDDTPPVPVQPRQTYTRQNTDPSQQFSVPRKPLRPRSESMQESKALLPGQNDMMTSEPVDEHRDSTELQDLGPSNMSKVGSTDYSRLPSR